MPVLPSYRNQSIDLHSKLRATLALNGLIKCARNPSRIIWRIYKRNLCHQKNVWTFFRIPTDLNVEQTINANESAIRYVFINLFHICCQRWAQSHFLRMSVSSNMFTCQKKRKCFSSPLKSRNIRNVYSCLSLIIERIKENMNPFEAHDASYLFNMTTGKIAWKNGSDLL